MNRKPNSVQQALEQTKPVPDERFAQNLEDRLIARLHNHQEEREDETMIRILNQKRKNESGRAYRLPLTLTAALASVIVGGMILFGVGGAPQPPQFAGVIPGIEQAVVTQTPVPSPTMSIVLTPVTLEPTVLPILPTATPVPFTEQADGPLLGDYLPVLIAVRDFAVGETITADMISVAYWERDFAFAIAADQRGAWFYGEPERVIGAVVEIPVAQFQPISSLVGSIETPDARELTAFYLPPEGFIGDYSTLRTDTAAQVIILLDQDSPFLLSDVPQTIRADVSGRVLSFDVIVQIGSYTTNNPDGTTSSGQSARILLTMHESDFLQRLIDEQVPFHYTILPAS